MAATLELGPATAGKRLDAAILDCLAPVAVWVLTFTIGFAGITHAQSGGFITYDTTLLVLFGRLGMGLTVVYLVVLAGMEGRPGATIGNNAMAKTLVFDVNAGRNPINSGGIRGLYSFAPLDMPPVQPVASPVAQHAAPVQSYAAPFVPVQVTTPDGRGTHLQQGVPAFVNPGSTVHFGDRSLHLGQA